MFELDQQVMLTGVNARAEIHGDERVSAFDLTFAAECTSEVLSEFHPSLRNMLFKAPDSPDLVQQIGEGDTLTDLRFPLMGSLKWDWEGTGYHLSVAHGVGGKSDIQLMDCKVNKFKLTAINGGSVRVEFRVIVHPEVKDVGRLCEKIQTDIDITLKAPDPATVQQLFGDAA